MPQANSIINLPDLEVEKIEGIATVSIFARSTAKPICPHCKSHQCVIKQTFIRSVRHESIGMRKCFLKIRSHRFKCKRCRRSFNERFGGILRYQRASEPFKEEVFHKHTQGITESALEKALSIGHATIERWYHQIIEREFKERKNNPAPVMLGIDEHFFTRKQGYATTFVNLRNNRVHDVVLGRSEEDLQSYLRALRGRSKTELVFMDLSGTYRSIAKKYFPKAKVVADRFHVIRLINRYFMKSYLQLEPGELSSKGLRKLLRYHHWNLEKEDQKKLDDYLKQHPVLQALYEFKQNLCKILVLKTRTAKQCKKLIPKLTEMISQLEASPVKYLSGLGSTLENWKEEIVRMWRYRKTNSITEGLHTKMEMISRRSFGFKKFENYRMRVRVLCG